VFALYAANLGSFIEVVNRVGSYFYGSLLGVFVLAIGVRRATANGAFWGLLGGMVVVGIVETTTEISFIWFNVVGTVAVVMIGLAISFLQPAAES
jgi:Na+/proline symporter